jgi:hypothetical protein
MARERLADVCRRILPSTLVQKRRRVQPRAIRGLVADVAIDPDQDRFDLAGDFRECFLGGRLADLVRPSAPKRIEGGLHSERARIARVFGWG